MVDVPETAADTAAPRGSFRPFSFEWWSAGRGFAGVAQWPNPAISVWAVALLLKWSKAADSDTDRLLGGIATGALLVWALDELLRGVSPIRRVMGAIVLVMQAMVLLG